MREEPEETRREAEVGRAASIIRIELTEHQKAQIRKATGREVNALELRLGDLAPIDARRFFASGASQGIG